MNKKHYVEFLEGKKPECLEEGFEFPVKNISGKMKTKLGELEKVAKSNDKKAASKIAIEIIDMSNDVLNAITSI